MSVRARPAHGRAELLLLWVGGLAFALQVGVMAALAPIALVALAGLGAGLVAVYLAFTQPRWILVAEVAVLTSYAIDVVRANVAVPLTTETLLVLLVAGVAFRRVVGLESLRIPERELALVGAVVVAAAAATLFADERAAATERLAELGKNAVLAVLVVSLVDGVRWLRRLAWAFAGAAGTLGAVALAGRAAGSELFGFAELAADRGLLRSGGPLDPNFFGQLLLAGGLLCVYLRWSAGSARERAAAGALAAASFLALVLTFSRGTAIAAAAAVLLVAALRRISLWVPIAALAALVAAGALVLPDAQRRYFGALVSPASRGIAAASDASLRERFGESHAALRMFADHPFIGVGPGNYPVLYLEYSQEVGLDRSAEPKAPHNLYLEVLAENGVLGGLALAAVLAAAAGGAWRARRVLHGRDALLAEGIVVALAAFLVNGIFLHASAFPRYLWILVALGLAAGRVARREEVRI